jgi:hypothetical protein
MRGVWHGAGALASSSCGTELESASRRARPCATARACSPPTAATWDPRARRPRPTTSILSPLLRQPDRRTLRPTIRTSGRSLHAVARVEYLAAARHVGRRAHGLMNSIAALLGADIGATACRRRPRLDSTRLLRSLFRRWLCALKEHVKRHAPACGRGQSGVRRALAAEGARRLVCMCRTACSRRVVVLVLLAVARAWKATVFLSATGCDTTSPATLQLATHDGQKAGRICTLRMPCSCMKSVHQHLSSTRSSHACLHKNAINVVNVVHAAMARS